MARYKVILAYDGTDYAGFQRQAARVSIQQEVEAALRSIGWKGRAILASGRTDSGVHASGQVISFDLSWKHGEQALLHALNANLPEAITAQQITIAPDDFHPRYDAIARDYGYQIYCQPVRQPLKQRYAWRVWPAPDIILMNLAAQDLIGEHDFVAFGKALKPEGTTMRNVHQAEWKIAPDGCTFHIQANAFLYHMVRRIVYVLVQIGLGKQDVTIVRRGLETGDTGLVALAPAQGLMLQGVYYKA